MDGCQDGLHDVQGEAGGRGPFLVQSKVIRVCNYLKGIYKDARAKLVSVVTDDVTRPKTCFQLERFTVNTMKNYSTGKVV